MKPIKIAHKLYSTAWKIFKPTTVGVRAILIKDGKILLVKHSYQKHWYLPGGGLKNGESFEQGIRRELQEELGTTVDDLKLHGVYNNFYEGKNDSIIVFQITNFEIKSKKNREIENFDFFEFKNLPEQVSPGTRRRIEEFTSGNFPTVGLW